MNILAIETSSPQCSVALLHDAAIIELNDITPRTHAQQILPMIQQLLTQADLKLNQLDALAYGKGPGSFTGLRIGAGVIQGIALGSDIPVIPISSLQCLAQTGYAKHQQSRIISCIDARMQEVYWGMFELDPVTGLMQLNGDEAVTPPEMINLPTAAWYGVGNGWHYPQLGARFAADNYDLNCLPTARAMLALAKIKLTLGETTTAEFCYSTYIRDKVVR